MTSPSARAFFHHELSEAATVRLLCFPAAGGAAHTYRDWARRLPETVEVAPVQLAGRANRFRDPLRESVQAHVDEVEEALAALAPLPLVLFGNSMGALIAYELALRLDGKGAPPRELWVCGHPAPHCPRRFEDVRHLDDAAFVDKLHELEGTPPEVMANAEMLELFLPLLRADFAVFETYPRRLRRPLSCPVTAIAGTEDPLVIGGELEAWKETTSASFVAERVEGDHFIVDSATDRVLALLGASLAG